MAKIQDLQVESVHLVGGSITASDIDSGVGLGKTVTSVNPEDKPTQLFWNITFFYISQVSDGTASVTYKVERTRSSLTIFTETVSDSGNTVGANRFQSRAGSWIDMASAANDEYKLTLVSSSGSGGPPAGAMGVSDSKIAILWVKR